MKSIVCFLRHSKRWNSSKKLLDNQSLLPRLPIPSLENMASKYLASCKPLLGPTDYAKTDAIVKEFISPNGFGQVLQKRLVEYDKTQQNSWLEDIWLKKAYLEWREPSLINVNWWCEFVDHPNHPIDLLKKPPPKGVLSSFQLKRAAGLISNLLNFRDELNSGSFQPEYIKDKPLCMNQYTNIFGMTRIPGNPDTISCQFPNESQHIVVMFKNQIYKLQVVSDEGRVSINEIERSLFEIGQDAYSTQAEPSVGILTAGHRDNWFEAYEKLKISNSENFKTIQDAIFVLCLDDHSSRKNVDESHLQIFHNRNASNRWFDKAIQLIVTSSGRAGVNGEHSPVDAVVPGVLFNYALSREPAKDPENVVEGARLKPPVKLIWKDVKAVESHMEKARKTAVDLIQDTESCLLQTDIYGSRYIKEVASSSPDAYVQIALQLAYIRLHKKPTAVYESASTRLFKHGRTETGRSLSSESLAFCKAFDDDSVLYEDKAKLFKTAINTQSAYMKEASFGKGIDRHMLGLRCMINADEQDKATLFKDPAYTKSMYFKLSTSNMSPGKYFYGGFGPVVPDGYGVNYAIDVDSLKFSISSKKSCPETSSYKFRESLERTLKDLFILFPKRTQVWGYGWEKKHQEEKKQKRQFEKMKELGEKTRQQQLQSFEKQRK